MAERSGSYTLGIVLVIVGGLMLLGQLGINVGWIIALVIAGYLVYKGWGLYKHAESSGKRGLGICLIVVGLLWMTGLLPIIIGLVVAAVVMYFGWNLLKSKPQATVATEPPLYDDSRELRHRDPMGKSDRRTDHLDEWEREVKNRLNAKEETE
ncbi:MAG: hypothetical protein LOD88_03180 [Novibacillus thermophilus]